MEKIKNDTYEIVTIKRVQELFKWTISVATASRKINLVRDALNKPRPQIITVTEFKEFFCL